MLKYPLMPNEGEGHIGVCKEGATFFITHEGSTVTIRGTGLVKGEHTSRVLPFGDQAGHMAVTIEKCTSCKGDIKKCFVAK